jgi:hypothetical protein
MAEVMIIQVPFYYNTGISVDNVLFCDTNDSANWKTYVEALPKPRLGYKWTIKSSELGIVVLVQKENEQETDTNG